MGATVLSVSSRAMLEACARLGLQPARLLAAAQLDRATVEDPDARIPLDRVATLWREAYEVSGDPNLALHAIEVLPFGAYRVVDLLSASAPTIGASITKVSNYFPLINDVVRLPIAIGTRHVTMGVEAPTHPAAITRPYAEYTMAAVFLRTRMATNQRYPLTRVEFPHPRPPDIREHERIFECPVIFDAEACRLVIDMDVWNTPRAREDRTDPVLFSVLDAHARMLLDQRPAAPDIVARLRDAIDAELQGGRPDLESIARRMAMGSRTLQRRLKEAGVVFNDELDARRFRAAKAYLAQGDVAGAEVSYLLGFAEPSSFNRAFKRWSGQTPTEYRRRAAV